MNHSASIEIRPQPPYNWEVACFYLRTSPSAVLESVDSAGIYRRALTLDGIDALLKVQSLGTVDQPVLRLDVQGAAINEGTVRLALEQIRRTFLLDEDPSAFQAVVAADPVVSAVLAPYRGLRPVLIADPYEALIWAIIGQQINVSFARKLKIALSLLCGGALEVGDERFPLLPSPETVAALDPAALQGLQFSRQKVQYLIDTSAAVASGSINFADLATMPYDEAVAALIRHRGIGRWTAEYVMMRGLGARDSIPAADLGLRAIIGRAYGLDRTAAEDEVREIAQRWAGWRGWVSWVWWLQLQREHAGGM